MSDMTKSELSPDILRQLLRYEPDTGKLFWNPRPIGFFATAGAFRSWNTRRANQEAFTFTDSQGYKRGCLFGSAYKAHRVAWMIATGRAPLFQIDHVNGDKTDNRLANLREATQSENQFNQRLRSDNSSGIKGVRWKKSSARWVAVVAAGGKQVHLGYFDKKEDAAKAVQSARDNLHGEFARHG